MSSGRSLEELSKDFKSLPNPFVGIKKNVLWLDRENPDVERRIHHRTQRMLEDGLVEETKGKQSKIDILKQFTSRNDVKYALKAAFDDRVQFTLPEGLPEGTQIGDPDTPEGAMDIAPERFIRVFKRMQYWVKGGLANSTSKVAKQEEIFLNTLRSLEKSEAEFLLAIKDKTMPFKSVTKEICEDAGFDLTPK